MKGHSMATSSILGGDPAPTWPRGSDVASLGPSDSTDSGSDARGGFDFDELNSDTDAEGTGERSSVDPLNVRSDADILPDHIEGMPALNMEIAIETAAEDDLALLEDIDRSEISALATQEEPLDSADEEEES
jgi:hypothetical protein